MNTLYNIVGQLNLSKAGEKLKIKSMIITDCNKEIIRTIPSNIDFIYPAFLKEVTNCCHTLNIYTTLQHIV